VRGRDLRRLARHGKGRIGGIPLELDLFQVWTAREGRLTRHRGFLDRERALAAAGIRPE
jgi:hypothetical protein